MRKYLEEFDSILSLALITITVDASRAEASIVQIVVQVVRTALCLSEDNSQQL